MSTEICLVRDPFLSVLLEILKRLVDGHVLGNLISHDEPRFPTERSPGPHALPLETFLDLRDRAQRAYGAVATEGLLWRAGSLAGGLLRHRLGNEMGFRQESFGLLFPRQRAYTALLALAATYQCYTPFSVEVSTQGETWLWQMRLQSCHQAAGQRMSTASFTAGLIQGLLAELNGGKFYAVHYTLAAPGAVLGLEVAREPLDG